MTEIINIEEAEEGGTHELDGDLLVGLHVGACRDRKTELVVSGGGGEIRRKTIALGSGGGRGGTNRGRSPRRSRSRACGRRGTCCRCAAPSPCLPDRADRKLPPAGTTMIPGSAGASHAATDRTGPDRLLAGENRGKELGARVDRSEELGILACTSSGRGRKAGRRKY